MNKLRLSSSAFILASGLVALPASASDHSFSTELAGDLAEALVEQVVSVSEELGHELQISINQSAETLWEELTDYSDESNSEGPE